MKSKWMGALRKVVGGCMIGLAPAAAFAQSGGIDTGAITTAITAATTAIALVGAAVVSGPKVTAKVYKWISSAL